MPILSTSTLIRARARLARSQSWRSKIRSAASETFRYSPSSASANSVIVSAMRGMIEVPPPTRILKPRTPSRTRGRKPRSWMGVIARSASEAVKAVFHLRGISWVVGWRTK